MDSTTWHNLSSTVEQTLKQIEETINANPSLSAIRQLSAVPAHPYEQTLYKLYGPDYKNHKFKQIDEILPPLSLDFEKINKTLEINREYVNKTIQHNLTALPHQQLRTIVDALSNDVVVPNIDMQKNIIEFAEMIKQIPSDKINEITSIDYARKILDQYSKLNIVAW